MGLLLLALCGCSSSDDEAAEPECGGDPVGTWQATNAAVPPRPVMNVDACWNLMLSRGADGTLAASSRYKVPGTRDGMLRFNDDRTFSLGITARGDVVMGYSASCLEAVSPKPTCAELAPALAVYGVGEGSVRSVVCSASSGAGCDCTFAVAEAGGYSGTWLTSGSELSLTPELGQMSEPSIVGSYCAKDGVLQLSSDFDARFYGISRMKFEAISCNDGKQSRFEDGIDCGGSCGLPCP